MKQVLRNVAQRTALMIARGIVKTINDSTMRQQLNIDLLAGESRADIERFQNYGFSSVPTSGAEAVVIFVGGNREHGLAIAVEDKTLRPKNLQAGDVCIYDNRGNKITMNATGIVLDSSLKVIINANIETTGTILNNGVNIGSTHVHGGGSPPS